MKKLYLLLPVVFLFLKANAQQNVFDWGRSANNNNLSINGGFGECVTGAIDINKNVVGAGFDLEGVLIFGSDTINTTICPVAAFFFKYDSSGNAQWARQATCNYSDDYSSCSAVATDHADNYYFTGWYNDTISFGATQLAGGNFHSMFIVKYDQNGNVVWATKATEYQSADTFNVSPNAIASDNDGNVYVTGTFFGPVSFDGQQFNDSTTTIFTAKYDANGNVIWVKVSQYVTPDQDPVVAYGPNSIAIDKYKNIYIAGVFTNTLTIGTQTLVAPSSYIPNIFIAKYDSTGKLLWLQQPHTDGKGDQFGIFDVPITIDKEGNLYVSGPYIDSISFGNVTIISPTAQTDNIFVVKMDGSGKALWGITTKSDLNNFWNSYSMAADTLSNIYLSCGDATNPGYDTIQFGGLVMTCYNDPNGQDGNSAIFKIDTTGTVNCGYMVGVGGDDWNFITADPTGKYVYFGGDIGSNVKFGPDSLMVKLGNELPFVARWKPCRATTGIAPLSAANNQITIYPNPTSNQLTISAEPGSIKQITITDLLGQIIYKSPTEDLRTAKQTLNVNALLDGLYFVAVKTDKGIEVEKVIVNK